MEQFEKGTKFYSGITPVVDLNGTWHEMGRQYGALLSAELKDMYKRAICDKVFNDAGGKEAAIKTADKLYLAYPFRLKEFFKGMTETSGLELDELKLINAVEFIAFTAEIQPGCAGIAVWGDYASDALIYGRNYDYCEWFKTVANNLVFVAFHPADGALSTVTVGLAGEIYAVSAMNEKGIFMELNNGAFSGGSLTFDNRIPSVVKLLECMFDCASLADIERFFQTTKANFAYIIGVTDGQIAQCYEWPTFGVNMRKTHSRPGLTVLTNHFTESCWGLPHPDDAKSMQTVSRRDNLLALAKHFKGAIDTSIMQGIMDTKVENGGATNDTTIYQLVAEPGKFMLWFKIPGLQDWIYIDMKVLLRPREV